MKILESTWKATGTMHHAYFLVGDGEGILEELLPFLEETVGIQTIGNPDFLKKKFATLGIDEVRDITTAQQYKEYASGRKIFIIETNVITEGAQNALLKVFEEPTLGTHFFIISPQDILLPTLRSRMQIILYDKGNEGQTKKESILSKNLVDRLELVKQIIEGISDEEKTKQDAISILNSIERELYNKGVEKNADALRVCEAARASLYDNGAPVKIILENVMLCI